MNQYHYLPIVTESTKNTFFEYINAIKLTPIDYFAVGIAHTVQKKFTSLTSRTDWQTHFQKEQLSKNDPLIKAEILSQRSLIPFSEIDYIDSSGKEVMRQRRLHGIKDGLLLIHTAGHLKYRIMIATGFSKFDYYAFLKKYHTKLGRLKQDLTKIIERDSQQFLLS